MSFPRPRRLLIITIAILILLGTIAGLSLRSCQKNAARLTARLAEAETRQATLDQRLAALDRTLRTRRDSVPAAKLWITADRVVHRTAVPEENAKGLSWVALHNGREILQAIANHRLDLDTARVRENGPGTYTFFITAWINDTYLPISNIVSFHLRPDGKTEPPAVSPTPATRPPTSVNPTANPAASPLVRAQQLRDRIERGLDRLSESDAYLAQQATLPHTLTIWMDHDGVINRNVGPDDLEETILIAVGGTGRLRRNARYETQYRTFYQGPGQYTSHYTSTVGTGQEHPISNEIHYTFAPASDPAAYPPPTAIPDPDQ